MTEPAHVASGLKVLVIGADPVLRHGVAQYLQLTIPTATTVEALSDSEGFELVRVSAWGAIVLDLLNIDELALVSQLKVAAQDVPILVLIVDPTPESVQAARTAGSAGCLNKGSPAQEWRAALETVAKGGVYPSHIEAEVGRGAP